MGIQDRDYYREHWRKQRKSATTVKAKTPAVRSYIGPMPRWAIFVYSALAAYGLVALARDLAKLFFR